MFYNPVKRHSHNSGLSPIKYEEAFFSGSKVSSKAWEVHLVDRDIIKETDLSSISRNAECLSALFSTPQAMEDTCLWLDETFNGDLLSLEDKDYRRLLFRIGDSMEKVCWSLSNIQYHASGGQLQLDWDGSNFSMFRWMC